MPTVFLSYAWKDNDEGDVEFVAQELGKAGLEVKMDRWNVSAGDRLWEQVGKFISSDEESQAWAIYATTNSLTSQPCREELGYALNRALQNRGQAYPIIGIFPGSVDRSLIPQAITSRLYVSLEDKHWVERVKAATEHRAPAIPRDQFEPFALKIHDFTDGQGRQRKVIEVRPRAGHWPAVIFSYPKTEHTALDPLVLAGPSGQVPMACMTSISNGDGHHDGIEILYFICSNGASPTQSCYFVCNQLPSSLTFGEWKGQGPGETFTANWAKS